VKMFNAGKTRMLGVPYGKKTVMIMLSRFHLIPERYGQTDRQTDRRTDLLYQYRASLRRAGTCRYGGKRGAENVMPKVERVVSRKEMPPADNKGSAGDRRELPQRDPGPKTRRNFEEGIWHILCLSQGRW